jgi:thymidylate synthase
MFQTITELNKRSRRIGANRDAVLCCAEPHDERQYCNLVWDVLGYGSTEQTRNGVTRSVFGAGMHFSLEGNVLPLLTTKRVAWVTCLKELLWFIRGSTDNAILKTQGVRIWDGNASREFLDSRGLSNLRENDLGPVYGHQWRHFNAPYSSCDADYAGQGVDQLGEIIAMLKDPAQRTSRRMVLSAWNPQQLNEMALPPCHVLMQFNVSCGDRLSCAMYQRSGDIGLGVPFNIASYALLTHLLAHHCGLRAHDFVYHLGNAHIYEEHVPALTAQIEREPHPFPKINIVGEPKERIEDYCPADFVVQDYVCHGPIKMDMKV